MLGADLATADRNTPVQLTATVDTVSGKVTFFVDGTSIGKAVVTSDGVATLSHSFKQGGTYAVTAVLAKTNSTVAVTSDPVSVSVNR